MVFCWQNERKKETWAAAVKLDYETKALRSMKINDQRERNDNTKATNLLILCGLINDHINAPRLYIHRDRVCICVACASHIWALYDYKTFSPTHSEKYAKRRENYQSIADGNNFVVLFFLLLFTLLSPNGFAQTTQRNAATLNMHRCVCVCV